MPGSRTHGSSVAEYTGARSGAEGEELSLGIKVRLERTYGLANEKVVIAVPALQLGPVFEMALKLPEISVSNTEADPPRTAKQFPLSVPPISKVRAVPFTEPLK